MLIRGEAKVFVGGLIFAQKIARADAEGVQNAPQFQRRRRGVKIEPDFRLNAPLAKQSKRCARL